MAMGVMGHPSRTVTPPRQRYCRNRGVARTGLLGLDLATVKLVDPTHWAGALEYGVGMCMDMAGVTL